MDRKYTYNQLFELVKVAGHDYDSDLELGNAIISNLIDYNAVDAQAFYGAGGCPVRKFDFAMLIAHRMLPDWKWRLLFNGVDYTYTTHSDIMAGEFGEWTAHSMAVAVLGAMFQALINIEERKNSG